MNNNYNIHKMEDSCNIEYQVSPSMIIDTLIKHESLEKYQTYFTEAGWRLSSYLYGGMLNGEKFSIKTNCNDGTVILYMKKKNKWNIIDSIDEQIGWNFKTMKYEDLNNDKYLDVILIDHMNYQRISFIFNRLKKTFEHKSEYDIIL